MNSIDHYLNESKNIEGYPIEKLLDDKKILNGFKKSLHNDIDNQVRLKDGIYEITETDYINVGADNMQDFYYVGLGFRPPIKFEVNGKNVSLIDSGEMFSSVFTDSDSNKDLSNKTLDKKLQGIVNDVLNENYKTK